MASGYFGGIVGATGGLNVPTYSVQVSFTDPFDTPDWVDITRWCRSGSTKRGRQHELQRGTAGTCSLTISNQDGRFSTFNTTSPYVNLMTGADSYFADQAIGDTTPGSWSALLNCALNLIANLGFDGYPAMSLTAASAATMSASTATGTSGYPVTAGTTYGFMAQFKTAVTTRACSVGVGWYNSGGTIIGSVTYGSTVNDTTSGYTKASLTATAPAGATFAALFAQVTSPANGEVHYVTRCMISNADTYGNVSSGWAPGGRGLVPARPLQVLATWSSVQYPVFYGYVDSWVPSYGTMLSDQVLNATDGMALLALPYITTSGYRAQVLADGAIAYWRMGDPTPSFVDSTGNASPLTPVGVTTVATTGVAGSLFGDTDAAASVTILGPVTAYPLGASGVVSGSSFASAGPAWTIECWANIATIPGTNQDLQILTLNPAGAHIMAMLAKQTTGFAAGGAASFNNISSVNICDGHWHHLVGTYTSGHVFTLYVDGVSQFTGSGVALASPLTSVQVGAQVPSPTLDVDEVAIYPTALSAATVALHTALGKTGFVQQQSGQRIGAVLTALGVPASLQSLSTGISAVQAPTAALSTTPALSHIQTVETTEQGFFYVDESGNYTFRDRHYVLQNAATTTSNGTFADDANGAHFKYLIGSFVPASDDLDLWNDWPVSAIANAGLGVTGALQDAPNADSIRWYAKRTKTGYTSLLMTTDTEAASLSQWGVAHYGAPLSRVRQIKLDSTNTTPSSLPQMLGRKLLDRISTVRQPMDGTASPFTQDSLIESIQHDFSPALWTTTWGLSVAETQQYFTLNDAKLGTLAATGALTGNHLGY